MRKLSLLLVAILIVSMCAPLALAQEKKLRIGIANYTQGAPYFVGMKEAVEAEASVYKNIELYVSDAKDSAAKMLEDIQDMIVKGLDGIIISGGPLEALPPALIALEEEGIPVVLVDRLLKGGEYTSWIGPDNYQIGVQSGKYIVERLNGKGKLVIIKGGPADNSIGLDRTNGMLSVVSQYPDIEVVATGWAGWNTEQGVQVMEDILVAHPEIDAVFCENDSMALGAMIAIQNAGRDDEIFIVGVDGQKEAILAIAQGTCFAATSVNNSDTIGRMGFNRLMAILAGAVPEKNTPVDSPLITIENAERFYNPDSIF